MTNPGAHHLCYCTNVHPYSDLAGMRAVLEGEAAQLRQRLCEREVLGDDEFLGVGLWMPAEVADAVARDPGPLARLLERQRMEVRTVNAFPHGAFHGRRVKDEVFRPAWTEPERLRYTLVAAEALVALLPPGAWGSISTHTGAYKPWGGAACDEQAVADGFVAAAEGLARLEDRTGRRVVLALEPEPFALLETTAEVISFFGERLLPRGEATARHLGVCFDACHQAVQFERMTDSLEALDLAGVPVAKVQLSSAIVVANPARDAQALGPWADDRWFHQVVARMPDGALRRIADLPEALADEAAGRAEEWRVHFHVPIFAASLDEEGRLGTTQDPLADLLGEVGTSLRALHLEIETYSWGMIPEERRQSLGAGTLLECLEREWAWARAWLADCGIGGGSR